MAEESFKEYGKEEAIVLLFEGTGFDREEKPAFEAAPGSTVVNASRFFLEGIDFDLTYFPLKHLGYKCVAALAGDIYASIAHPRTLSVKLGLSAKLDFSHVRELWSGVVTAAREHGFKSTGSLCVFPLLERNLS